MSLYKLTFRHEPHAIFTDQKDVIEFCKSWAASEAVNEHYFPSIHRLEFNDKGMCRVLLCRGTETDVLDERFNCPAVLDMYTEGDEKTHTIEIPNLGEDNGPPNLDNLKVFEISVDFFEMSDIEIDEDRSADYFILAKDREAAIAKFEELPLECSEWTKNGARLCWWANPYTPKHDIYYKERDRL